MNFEPKSDYENPQMQISNQNFPVVAQPMAHPMITQPIGNMGNQIVQTNANQMPSQSATINSTAGQIIASTISLVESELKPSQNEPSQTDNGDAYVINDAQRPESQLTIAN